MIKRARGVVLCCAGLVVFAGALAGCASKERRLEPGWVDAVGSISRFFADNADNVLSVEVGDQAGWSLRSLDLTPEDEKQIIKSLRDLPPQPVPLKDERVFPVRLLTGRYCTTVALQGSRYTLVIYLLSGVGFATGAKEEYCFLSPSLAAAIENVYERNGLLVGSPGRHMRYSLDCAAGKNSSMPMGLTRAESQAEHDEEKRLARSYELSRTEAAVLEDTMAYLKAGGNVNADIDGRGNTLLHLAARNGYRTVLENLLVYGANVNARNGFGVTPLHRATQPPNEACAAMLIFRGADVNAQTESGETPLHFLSLGGFVPERVPLATMLMLNGADPELRDKDGRVTRYEQVLGATPMQRAIRLGKWDVARALAAAGGPLDVFAAASLGAADMVANLLKKAPDLVRANGPFGDSPLHFAAKGGQAEVAGLLIDKGAAVNTPGEDGWYPLHAAAWGNHEKVVRLLIERGADVNAKDRSGKTPLWHAPEAMARLLVEKGADPNARDSVGGTLLHRRAAAGQENWVRLLVSLGADPNAKTEDGETAADLARRNGCDGVAEVLNPYGGAAK